MDYTQLIESMRSFEADHKPDGWPAIRMHFVSEMCDAIETLQAEANSCGSGAGCLYKDAQIEALEAQVLELTSESETFSQSYGLLVVERDSALAKLAALEITKDAAYAERNRLVSLLSKVFPSGKKKTAIEGWSEAWHGCVYIDLPTGQASWHYHDSQSWLFDHLPEYAGGWDGHTSDEKYERIQLFAAGAQAQPLREDEIESIDDSMCGERDFIVAFARAIEKAHQIGGSV